MANPRLPVKWFVKMELVLLWKTFNYKADTVLYQENSITNTCMHHYGNQK